MLCTNSLTAIRSAIDPLDLANQPDILLFYRVEVGFSIAVSSLVVGFLVKCFCKVDEENGNPCRAQIWFRAR